MDAGEEFARAGLGRYVDQLDVRYPKLEALPDFAVLINPEIDAGNEYRTSVETFTRQPGD